MLVNLSTCFFTIDSEFFFYFSKKWIGRAMGNKTFYGDGLTVLGGRLHISTNFSRGTPSPGTVQLIIIGVLPVVSSSSKKTMKCLPMRRYPATRKCHDPQNFNKVVWSRYSHSKDHAKSALLLIHVSCCLAASITTFYLDVYHIHSKMFTQNCRCVPPLRGVLCKSLGVGVLLGHWNHYPVLDHDLLNFSTQFSTRHQNNLP